MMLEVNSKKITFTDFVLWAALILIGGFHEYISCALSFIMSIYLLIRLGAGKKLRIRLGMLPLSVFLICAGYGLSCFWAIDKGMAFVGFLKFLPLILYLLCLWQEDSRGKALQVLPYLGAVIAVISGVGMQFEAGKSLFSVAGRLAGFFQYPNTFAIFLLTCQLLLLKKEKKTLWDLLTILILIAGVLYTGSRTAFVVFLAANGAMLFTHVKQKTKWILAGGVLAAVVLAVIFAGNENSVLHRYLTISLTESTFVGRILYLVDALPLLLKYPFGMGYMGYFYIQNSIQTGIYDVAYIHNDFMQLFLDVGLIPGGLFLAAIVRWFFRKEVSGADKIIVGAICLHSLFDFNLQFVGMFLVLLLLLEQDGGEYRTVNNTFLPKLGATVLAVAGIYMGAALMLGHGGQYELSNTLYPWNTRIKLAALEQTEDMEAANRLADEILKQNTGYFAPYSVKAKYYYSQGNFASLIRYKSFVFEKRPFDYKEYEEYCKMLIAGITLYENAGDQSSADICRQELRKIPEMLEENTRRLSRLGAMIDDQPITRLPEEIQSYIDKIGG